LIEESGGEAAFFRADTSRPRDNEALVADAIKRFGALHVAVNNAGIGGPTAPIGEYPIEGWDKVIAVNLSGVFYGMRYQIPAMRSGGGGAIRGAIVNMASILGQVGFRSSGAYVAAKHGVVGLTKNAALEYAREGIRVNAVGPGFIKTPLVEKSLDAAALKAVEGMHPVGRLGEPDEVAELVLWLASDKASFVTGAYYTVDGGYLAQ
jgi:NAD(P)-dependent dehydrogenase (short-subunit alcohol dehydrogenase family)